VPRRPGSSSANSSPREPRHQVAVAHHLLCQPRRHGLQQAVAEGVAEHVVDMLEAVEVEHQHGHRRA
jgi:hypothetical protein